MWLFLLGLGLQLAGGLAALLLGRSAKTAHALGAGAAVLGALASIGGVGLALVVPGHASVHAPWAVPFGSFALGMDPLSALFVLAIDVVGIAAAIYGVPYLGQSTSSRRLGASWFFFNLLLAAMSLVVTAQNAVLFLVCWELMTIASFFLVTHDHERDEVRHAGWLYLVASHLGVAFLIALFALLGRGAPTLDFAHLAASTPTPLVAGLAFVLALIGFGVKAGFVPLHVWLPEAHPAAPSHVSAVMSGVMIKTGIYGLVRTLAWLGPVQSWWGWVLIGVGLTSGLLGVLLALAQHDLKRLLAYHSVENVGIIALGLGIGIVGLASGQPWLAAAGMAGGLLHVLNHALFKSLLFLAAGAVIHETGIRDLEKLGGLIRRMPVTGAVFLVGSVAIVGLPPLNGFVSELLIYAGALRAGAHAPLSYAGPLLACAAGLALIGGLAAACFVKAFGVVFLGVERRPLESHVSDPPLAMRLAMTVLAAACVVIGLSGPWVLRLLVPVVATAGTMSIAATASALEPLGAILMPITKVSWIAVGLAASLFALRAWLLRGRRVERSPTWDCGYALPQARMQYSASSFAEPLLQVFRVFVRSSRHAELPEGPFPKPGRFVTHARDPWMDDVFGRLFRRGAAFLDSFHWIQQGKVQLYVLYVVVTLVALLVWKLR